MKSLLFLLFTVAVGLAQSSAPTGTAPVKPPSAALMETKPAATAPEGTAPAVGDVKDPTKASPALKQAMTPPRPAAGAPAAAPPLPVVVMRGRVIAKHRPPTAIIEVDGKMYIVGIGSLVGGQGGSVMKVLDLNSTEIKLEVSPLNEVLILR